jgi:hypothetical protein
MSDKDKVVTRAATITATGKEIANADELIYYPRAAQREIKARFWEAWRVDPTVEAECVTSAEIVQETGESKVHSWWREYGFKEWFLNHESFVHKTISNGERGLDIIQEIMDDPRVRPDLRLKAAQISIDALTKFRDKTAVEKFADKDLAELSSEELDDRIKRLEARK